MDNEMKSRVYSMRVSASWLEDMTGILNVINKTSMTAGKAREANLPELTIYDLIMIALQVSYGVKQPTPIYSRSSYGKVCGGNLTPTEAYSAIKREIYLSKRFRPRRAHLTVIEGGKS